MKFITKSIRNKLIFTFLITIAIPLMISITVIYMNTREIVLNKTVQEAEQLFREGKQNITFYFDLINKASLSIYKSKYKEKTFRIIAKKEYDDETNQFLVQALNLMYDFDDDIEQIYLYMEPIHRRFLFKDYLMSSNTTSEGFTQTFKTDTIVTAPHMSTNYGIAHIIKKNTQVISFQRVLYEIPSDEQVGQLNIDVNANVLERLCVNLYDPQNDGFYLVNLDNQEILFASDKAKVGLSMQQDLFMKSQSAIKAGNFSFTWKDDQFQGTCVVDQIEKPYMNLLLVKLIPDEVISAEIGHLVQFTIIVGGITILGIILVSIIISFNFTKPINELLDTIYQVRQGKLDTTARIETDDEFGKLNQHFNEMLESINEHITIEYKLGMENTQNELRALQSQINSHFMNNILQAIGTEALKEKNMKVYKLIVQLGNMMQYSMRNQNQVVRLQDEVEYCTNYLELQKHRFDGAFEFSMTVSEEARNIEVPKVILQPIIENCFKHGLKETRDMGFINVRGYILNERLIILVEDNGSGITEEQITAINENFRNLEIANNNETSIGLTNIYKRLVFYYKGRASISLHKSATGGLTVMLDLPLIMDFRGGMNFESLDS